MKTSELTGDKLDYWVAKAQRWTQVVNAAGNGNNWECNETGFHTDYHPTTNWQQCGELIALPTFHWVQKLREPRVATGDTYAAKFDNVFPAMYGSTPQEAICRAVCASVFGEEIPDE